MSDIPAPSFHENPSSKVITSLNPAELLRLESINGIPVDTLNRLLKPNREYVSRMFHDFETEPDQDLIDNCTPPEELGSVIIDSGLIGPHDDIREVLAFQRAFLDEVLDNTENPHQLISKEIGKLMDFVDKLEGGMGAIDFQGISSRKRLYVIRKRSPVPALSPFKDGDASNLDYQIFDVTGLEKIDGNTLNAQAAKGLATIISGLHEKFAGNYGFYEESEPFFSYEDPFTKKQSTIENTHTFLPVGLQVLGITNKTIEELRSKYKKFQQEYKRTS